ncbi:hypothetical protein ACW9HQ_42705 [Nocardia gipuzkoensis]
MHYPRLSAAVAVAVGLGFVTSAVAHADPAPEAPHHAFGLDSGAARDSLGRDTSVGTALPVQVGAVGAPPAS